jgi:hypothetical protein
MEKMKIKRNPFLVKPIFANEVFLVCEVKGNKKTKKAEGFIRLLFMDTRGNVVSEIVLSKITAEALSRILTKNVKLLEEKIEEVKKKKKKRIISPHYIG